MLKNKRLQERRKQIPEDMKIYQTETMALISENDYQFLSDNQKEKCKLIN